MESSRRALLAFVSLGDNDVGLGDFGAGRALNSGLDSSPLAAEALAAATSDVRDLLDRVSRGFSAPAVYVDLGTGRARNEPVLFRRGSVRLYFLMGVLFGYVWVLLIFFGLGVCIDSPGRLVGAARFDADVKGDAT
mmetsp:Transcript_16032/g.37824  ORF Transcript_16032/g.37824 Transcript_16032/m.37824 type:complete len:136 (+) Transcript_16032:338-745(+)